MKEITVPNRLNKIDAYALSYCYDLENIYYGGTVYEWNILSKIKEWDFSTSGYNVICSDGVIGNDGTVTYK